ncbi:MAG: hypothetical protein KJZ60_10955, partial [Ignavibacteriaceae bacterium]|nr:hypothetical protein [Ignavibacteriaceae bacterium]
ISAREQFSFGNDFASEKPNPEEAPVIRIVLFLKFIYAGGILSKFGKEFNNLGRVLKLCRKESIGYLFTKIIPH